MIEKHEWVSPDGRDWIIEVDQEGRRARCARPFGGYMGLWRPADSLGNRNVDAEAKRLLNELDKPSPTVPYKRANLGLASSAESGWRQKCLNCGKTATFWVGITGGRVTIEWEDLEKVTRGG